MNLKTTHQKLPAQNFLRVSKSYVVNINFIDSFDNHNIFVDESEIPLGEVFRAEFFSGLFWGFAES